MSVTVRFAPSPTGYLHIGGARTALFNYLFAKNQGGKFLLRVEDTDAKRSTKEAIDAIIQGLEWLGLKHDGEIILQSENYLRHQEIAKKLLADNKAYYCYTALEELEEMRKLAEKKGEVFRFQSPWRDKAQSQTSSIKPVIRIKAPKEGQMVIKDLVQGEIKVASSELDDLVMLRGDGTPTYMLAVVVDDHDMQISHVIRGDDHLTNAFRQKIIYQALNWQVPEFAHIPLIHASDGTKMSKRHGAISVMEYKEMGYLPEALRNYLLRLGWSHHDQEIISDEEAIKWFSLDKVGRSPARFDFAKLDHLNKHYLKEKNSDQLFELITPYFQQQILESEKNRIIKALKFIKERAVKLNDLIDMVSVYLDYNNIQAQIIIDTETKKILLDKKDILFDLKNILSEITAQNFEHHYIKTEIDKYLTIKNLKIKDIGPALRAALTFSISSAGGIFEIIEILGKEEVILRLNQ
jgi:glutamyl-tRNA synthetase